MEMRIWLMTVAAEQRPGEAQKHGFEEWPSTGDTIFCGLPTLELHRPAPLDQFRLSLCGE
ncbi:hypothetical protein J6590_003149 [Homalodisca vitripennis]|nr:hypothetical protein J6590_003149 [Homalodisca vitripennis]